jgi:hypothetical protein
VSVPRRARVTFIAFPIALLGCPGDDDSPDDEVGETQGDSDGGGDGDGEPTCPPSAAGEYEVVLEPGFVPSEDDFLVLQGLCDPADDLFDPAAPTNMDWETENVQLLVYRPAEPGSANWPARPLPIVFHHHGNGNQRGDLYSHIAEGTAEHPDLGIVRDGAIFVSVGGAESDSPDDRAMIDICMLRWLFTADDWDGDSPGTGGASNLDGNVMIMGHSNGGEGAHIVYNWFEERPWQDDMGAPEHEMRLCGIIGLAPRGADLDESPFSTNVVITGAATVPYLTIEGSLDNDVPGGSLLNSSLSGFEEFHTPVDAGITSVWAYDAAHRSFGGCPSPCFEEDSLYVRGGEAIQIERGEAIAAGYVEAFVGRFLFGDTDAEGVLFGETWPMGLETNAAAWWDYHSAFSGSPLVFVGSEPHQSAADGEKGVRILVDTMCRWSMDMMFCLQMEIESGQSLTSEGETFIAENWPLGTLHSGTPEDLAAYLGDSYQTIALRADFAAPPNRPDDPPARTLRWILEPYDLTNATTFSFRASNIDGIAEGCTPLDGEPADEVDFEVVFVSVDDVEVPVNVSNYARLLAPDVYEVLDADSPALLCTVSHFLQTVRIPLDEVLCSAFPPEDLREVRFVFDRTDGPEGRAVLLDTIEFHQDLSAQPVCG